MNHIKKRFLIQYQTNIAKDMQKKGYDVSVLDNNFTNTKLLKDKNNVVLIETIDNETYGGFIHKLNGKNYVLPIPDPTLIYFNNAQESIRKIENQKNKLLKKLDLDNESLSESAMNELYSFYGTTSGFVIFLFTSIESFINQMINEDFVYKKILNNKTELYNKTQIQNNIDFKTKIKEILPRALGKDFFNKSTPTNQLIWNLKDYRNDIIHTKPQDNDYLKYQELIKKSLNFKYENTLDAVAKFMNFYKPGYIIECDCGVDF